MVCSPGSTLESPQELTKTCVQVPPLEVDLTGLGRCLSLGILFCCVIMGNFIQKENRKGGGTYDRGDGLFQQGECSDLKVCKCLLVLFCILFLNLQVILTGSQD